MQNILIIGDSILDVNHICTSNRLAQEACIPVMRLTKKEFILGGACNVYNNLCSMYSNQNIYFISQVGNDENGMIIKQKIKEISYSSDNYFIIEESRKTTTKNRYYVNNKIVFRCDDEDTHDISQTTEINILNKFKDIMPKIQLVVLSDYNKSLLTYKLTQNIINLSRSKNIPIFVDPKVSNFQKYIGCTLIKPNKKECTEILGRFDDPQLCATKMCEIFECDYCLLTLGEDGMFFHDNKRNLNYLETCEKKDIHSFDVDITGAGDVVLSAYIYGCIKKYDTAYNIKFANYCGQTKVRKFGTNVITKYDILLFKDTKIINNNEILDVIKIIKNAHKKIIFTNGCFDILHYGHLHLLSEAKKKGDILIVGLNSDESIKMNKGNSRPINNIHDRIKQMSMITCVDFIIIYNEKTPYEIIKLIRPDILIKGGDYKIENIIGREFATQTEIINYVDGYSSSNIIMKI